MKVSALDNKVVQEKAAELKKRSDKNMEVSKQRDLAITEARMISKNLKADAMAAKDPADAVGDRDAAAKVAFSAFAPATASAGSEIVVGINKREPTAEELEKAKAESSPQAVRNKARTLLGMNVLPPEQRQVLEEIITKQEMAERSKK